MLATLSELTEYCGGSASDAGLLTIALAQADIAVKEYLGYEVEFAQFTEYHPAYERASDTDALVSGYEGGFTGRFRDYGVRGQRAASRIGLRQLPVRRIISVAESLDAMDTSPPTFTNNLIEGGDFFVDWDGEWPGLDVALPKASRTGFLVRQAGSWPRLARRVRVIYEGGFSGPELTGRYSMFTTAVLQTATKFAREMKNMSINIASVGPAGPLISKGIDGYTRTWAGPGGGSTGSGQTATGFTNTLPESAMLLLEKWVRMEL